MLKMICVFLSRFSIHSALERESSINLVDSLFEFWRSRDDCDAPEGA